MRGTSLCRQFHASSYLTSITEAELDQLVAGCGRKTATFLQLLKETAARCGEACQLEWTDIDFRNNTLTITPEKGSNPRQFKVSGKLIAMLNKLPKTSQKVFGDGLLNHFRKNFTMQRKKVAAKLHNPRLDRIHFHTLRHWSATMLFHKTKSLPLVKERLGHRRLDSTLI